MRLHAAGGVIFFMNLAIGAKWRLTVSLGIKFMAENDFTRAKPRGDSIVHWEIIEP